MSRHQCTSGLCSTNLAVLGFRVKAMAGETCACWPATILLKIKSPAGKAAGLCTEQLAELQRTHQSCSRPAPPQALQTGPSTRSMQPEPCWPNLELSPMVQGDMAFLRLLACKALSMMPDNLYI